MATATVHTRTELRAFYALVLTLALYGQSTGASTWLIPADAGPLHTLLLWILVVAFVLVLELGAVVLLRRAEIQRRTGQKAAVAVLAAIALALAAAGLSWAGHWGAAVADQIQAWAFAGATLLGVIVWAIMADLSIDPVVARHRAVQSAVRRYIRDLSMDASEKAVLLATMDVAMITRLITGGPDALNDADERDRNVRIAKILARAIDPATWHGSTKPSKIESAPKAPRVEQAPKPVVPAAPAPQQPKTTSPRRADHPMTGSTHPADLPPAASRGAEWEQMPIGERVDLVWAECSVVPSAQQLATAVGCVKSTANDRINKILAGE